MSYYFHTFFAFLFADLFSRLIDDKGNSRSAGEAYNQAQEAKADAQSKAQDLKSSARDYKETGKQQARSHAQDVAGNRDPNASLSEQKEQVKGAAYDKKDAASAQAGQNLPDPNDEGNQQKARGKVAELKDRIPDEHRQKAADYIQKSKNFVNDELPEERRDQFIYRLKKVNILSLLAPTGQHVYPIFLGCRRMPGSQGLPGGHDLAP